MDEGEVKKKSIYVLDSSAFLSGAELSALDAVVVPSVVEELRHGIEAHRLDIMLQGKLVIVSPDDSHYEAVVKAARRTGDEGRLSRTDMEVLAVARQLKGSRPQARVVILSDDYSIQNLARNMELSCKSVATDGIREEWQWRLRCRGCGRYFDESPGPECPICGHVVRKVRAR